MTKTHATPHKLVNIAYTAGALSYCRRYVAAKNLRASREEVTCPKCAGLMEPTRDASEVKGLHDCEGCGIPIFDGPLCYVCLMAKVEA